jgi:N-methylhydantoinase B
MKSLLPGSENFNSRPITPEELMKRIPEKLKLHTVTQEMVDAVDPLTYEVIRHRLSAITTEMGEALKRMSGSIIVTEANDFDFTLSDEVGQEVQVGLYNTLLVGAMDLAIYWTLQNRSDNPGIEEGDMFLTNDPWIGGGLHQSDAAVIAPIFYDGKLFGWSTAICHELDLGGVGVGSFSPSATDVFWESVPTPPVKVVRNYELQHDVADLWVRRSRVPLLVGLDLRAKIGANMVARDRMLWLLDKYGPDLVKAIMKRMMDDAERRLRNKLRNLPDGTWHATGYQEQANKGDRGIHRISLAMTKKHDHLTFDFTGTSPQAGLINCTYGGLRGGVMMALLPSLAGDIPWAAGGFMRCFDILSEEGTINNALFPAAVSRAPIGPAWATGSLIAECFAKMFEANSQTLPEVQASCCGTYDTCCIAGLDQRGEVPVPFVNVFMDTMAGGYGAHVDRDGIDTGGLLCIPMGRCPDAEMTEFLQPFLVLWRREEKDSGGPGRYRGGLSGSICLAPYGSDVPMPIYFASTGKATTQNNGLAGGYPGNTELDIIVRSAHVTELLKTGQLPSNLNELGGTTEVMQCEDEGTMFPNDVLYLYWQAGGGYGDPLLRDPEAVVSDVREEKVSPEAASQIYGVVVDAQASAVDISATERQRGAIRQKRRQQASAPMTRPALDKLPDKTLERLRLDGNLSAVEIHGKKTILCSHCGFQLGDPADSQHDLFAHYQGTPSEAGPHIWSDPAIYLDARITFRQLYCPGCYTALYSAVVPEDHPTHLHAELVTH